MIMCCKLRQMTITCTNIMFVSSDINVTLLETFPSPVMVQIHGLVGSFCRTSWTDSEATVLCREKGYARGVAFGASTVNRFSTSLWLSVNCTGKESRLSNCKMNKSLQVSCSSSYEPGVFCLPTTGGT